MSESSLLLTPASGDLAAAVEFDAAMNYALAHNGISPLRRVQVSNSSLETLSNLQLEITLSAPVEGRIAAPLRATLPPVAARDTLAIGGSGVRWAFDAATFAQLDEAVTAAVTVRLFDATRMAHADGTLRLLARDEWWWSTIPESLAAFVTPRAKAIQDLVGDASDILARETGDPSIQGYQGGADRAMAIAAAIYDAMRARGIRYINPPASFEGTGQKIRPPHEVLVDRWGTCLDLATTHAAALEHAGLHPVLVLCEGHAFSGHLLEEQQLPELVVRDPRVILNYVESGLFIPVETVALCAGDNGGPFRHAIQATRDAGHWTHGLDGVRCLIDVAAAHRSVRPLPPVSIQDGVRVVEVERTPAPAPAPVSRRPAEEPEREARGGARPKRTYPPRVERWRNSLLDLSFRNPLLNMRGGNAALDLHVPRGSLGTVEDMLFGGTSI
ncbi:MAG TPA: hypothetical protein VFG79_00935, partial [Solirubrobacter sp.]|nr:hypothetical protein [Solirubrobacter sp.]